MSKHSCILISCIFFSLGINAQWQPDTNRIVQAWKFNGTLARIDTVKIDTLLPFFQEYNPVWKKHFTSTYLGNIGTAAQSNIPAERINQTEFSVFQPVQDYMLLPQDALFIHTKKPFTELNYISGGSKSTGEQTLRVLHTQNVNNQLNFVLRYNLISAVGQYPNQKAKDNAFCFSTNYMNKRYTAHGSFAVNKFDIQENGGIIGDTVLAPTDYTWVPVHLQNAGNRYLHLGAFVTQSLGFGRFPWQKNDTSVTSSETYLSSIHYTIRYDRYYRLFYDNKINVANSNGSKYLDSTYYHGLNLHYNSLADSVFLRKFSQTLVLQLHESPGSWFKVTGNAGFFHEIFSYVNYQQMLVNPFPAAEFNGLPALHNSYSNRTEILKNPNSRYIYNAGLQFFIQNEAGSHFAWNGSARYYLMGYNAGDYDLTFSLIGSFSGQWAAIQGGRSVHRADYYIRDYQSGSFNWDFTSQDISLKSTGTTFIGAITQGKIIDLSAEIRLYDHYVYSTFFSPAMASSAFITMTALAGKTFKLGRLYSSFNTALQYSGSDYLHLPLLSVRNTTWFEQSLVKDVLMSNLGFEVYYFTSYYADGYNPATGLFYTQNEFQSGNYPYLDVFLNMKLKTVRLMLKYDHVNSGLLSRTYFTAMHYPMQSRILKFGISWNFYN